MAGIKSDGKSVGAAAGAFIVWLILAAPVAAQTFEIPDGFSSEIVRQSTEGGSVAVLRIHPDDGAFSDLSTIEMRPIIDSIANPDGWLRSRVTADIELPQPDSDGIFDSPDSPLSDPAFDDMRGSVRSMLESLQSLGKLPLDYCQPPDTSANRAGPYREMTCVFAIGPLTQHLVFRLQDLDGVWYYTRIRTMNERRLRHLVAIANSFHID
ncbi:MAG: hypothetical protein VCC99_12440 [Alphaproteobacteria bacterium]